MKPSRTLRLLFLRLRRRLWRHLGRRISPPFGFDEAPQSQQTLIVLVPVIGVVVGLSSLGIAHLIHFLQGLFWGDGHDLLAAATSSSTRARILVPATGAALLGVLALVLRGRIKGLGTAGLMQALALEKGVVSLRQEYPGTATGILTVACGGSLGREGPMVEFGTALSSWLGRRFHLEPRELRILICAAAGAGMAAAYNAPIGGAMFAMEVLIGSIALEVLGPVVIAAVIATLITRNAMGELPRFVIPDYTLVSAWELIGYLVLGILGGLLAALIIRTMSTGADVFRKLPVPNALKPLLGFSLLGTLGVALPHVYGNGYETVNLVLHEGLPLKLLLILPVAKLLATALTRGSGGVGGMFTPTLMMGALLGGAFGTLVHAWFPAHTAGPGAYALVGMAAVLAGTTHAPIMALFMIFEQTDSYQIILPLMLVCIVSYAVAHRLQPRSLHLEALHRRGIELPRGGEAGIMRTMRVGQVMHTDAESVRVTDSMRTVVDFFLRYRFNYLYVVDDRHRFAGAIPFHSMKSILDQAPSLEMVIAQDLLDPNFPTVHPDDSLAATMDQFVLHNSERLPVVTNDDARTLVGWISKRDLIAVYKQEILGDSRSLSRFVQAGDTAGEHDRYVELPTDFEVAELMVTPAMAGKTIRELDPRGNFGVHVLQVLRYDADSGAFAVHMPGPGWVFSLQDRLVVVGPVEGIARFRESTP